jgi:membrane associated rhomboid family serine protease
MFFQPAIPTAASTNIITTALPEFLNSEPNQTVNFQSHASFLHIVCKKEYLWVFILILEQ